MKKRVLLLILVMVLSLGVTAFCENADNTGTVASKQEEAEALPKIIALKPVINEQLWILGLRDKMSEAAFELTNYISVDKELLSQLSFVIENEDELENVYTLEGDGRADEEGKVRLKFIPSQYGETVFKIKAILPDTKEYAEFELRIMVTDSVSVWAGSIGLDLLLLVILLLVIIFTLIIRLRSTKRSVIYDPDDAYKALPGWAIEIKGQLYFLSLSPLKLQYPEDEEPRTKRHCFCLSTDAEHSPKVYYINSQGEEVYAIIRRNYNF